MSDYNRDAALDQLAEWEEEYRMDEYDEQQWEKWNESVATTCSSPITAWGANKEDENDPDTAVLPETPDQDVVVVDFLDTTAILQKIEQEAEQQISHLLQQDAPVCAETCINIMQQGADAFRQQTGRNMTYSEMRNAFG